MKNRDLVKGVFLIAIALFFGLFALRYPIGQIERTGPGLFPLIVSSLLGIIGVAIVIRSHFGDKLQLNFNIRNIGLIVASLVAFAMVSDYISVAGGIVAMVFSATIAGASYSVFRNTKIAVGLLAIAYFFQKVFGLDLHL